ncbi:SCA7, zinc-binding domain-containing protein [Chytridium lagenaria]|nr:SCA7, zinc-binding domain-containing protein [Chytridium lagenaria]
MVKHYIINLSSIPYQATETISVQKDTMDKNDVADSSGLLVSDEIFVVLCNVCQKPLVHSGLLSHIGKYMHGFGLTGLENCRKVNPSADLFQQETGNNGASSKKKRKKELTSEGPIDLDKQCGVPLENGQLCSRSITCKIHSVSAKRAVFGRTQQYDTLFQEYHSKNRGG